MTAQRAQARGQNVNTKLERRALPKQRRLCAAGARQPRWGSPPQSALELLRSSDVREWRLGGRPRLNECCHCEP